MKKEACHLLLALVLAVAGVTGIWAEENLPMKLQQLLDGEYMKMESNAPIHKAVEESVGDAEPSDDLTKMCIKM